MPTAILGLEAMGSKLMMATHGAVFSWFSGWISLSLTGHWGEGNAMLEGAGP